VTEFYNEDNTPKIKKIWKNGKKDSTWTTFAKDGTIIKEELYRNDTLISNK
jgi:antitoxin component YwqK of YwqJK toxin-antitoxin module